MYFVKEGAMTAADFVAGMAEHFGKDNVAGAETKRVLGGR